jgi:hypothetical protein
MGYFSEEASAARREKRAAKIQAKIDAKQAKADAKAARRDARKNPVYVTKRLVGGNQTREINRMHEKGYDVVDSTAVPGTTGLPFVSEVVFTFKRRDAE